MRTVLFHGEWVGAAGADAGASGTAYSLTSVSNDDALTDLLILLSDVNHDEPMTAIGSPARVRVEQVSVVREMVSALAFLLFSASRVQVESPNCRAARAKLSLVRDRSVDPRLVFLFWYQKLPGGSFYEFSR